MSDNPEALHQRLMTQIQEFACAWSFAGGPFDDGTGMDRANEVKVEVESALRAALAQQAATPTDAVTKALQRLCDLNRRDVPIARAWADAESALAASRRAATPTDSRERSALIDAALAERGWPANPKAAALCGWDAALAASRQAAAKEKS